jgi:hypothetical protein
MRRERLRTVLFLLVGVAAVVVGGESAFGHPANLFEDLRRRTGAKAT